MTVVQWTDEDNVHHTIKDAEKVLSELYTQWPCGIDEIEASFAGYRRWTAWQEAKLEEIQALLYRVDPHLRDEIQTVISRPYDYRTGK